MSTESINAYEQIRSGSPGFYETQRGLIAVWGKEAVQFLDGMITNDMKTIEDGSQMLAAFPNAQGRLLAVVRVLRQGDRYLMETEAATREKLFNSLFRFTFAGDFFVEDLSDQYSAIELFGAEPDLTPESVKFKGGGSMLAFVPTESRDGLIADLESWSSTRIPDDVYETIRIENGVPKYGVDMDETTVVPELGIDELISYTKGCYIGQEIIARIHFRGHVAKRLTGLIAADAGQITSNSTVTTAEGKDAGRITSAAFSPKLGKSIALGLVRYDFLTEGTELHQDGGKLRVARLPFGL
jgi:folate-binding protein YgfZ